MYEKTLLCDAVCLFSECSFGLDDVSVSSRKSQKSSQGLGDSPMLASRQVMAWTSAPAYTSLSWLTTGRHIVWTRILRFPAGTKGSTMRDSSVFQGGVKLRANLCWRCRAERPGNRPETSLPESPRWTSGQRRPSLGLRWPRTAGQWSAQRSFRGTYGWTDLREVGNKRIKQLLKHLP